MACKKCEGKLIEFNDPRLVLICAFRYALGRCSYMPSVIVEELIANWEYLTDTDKKQIQIDIENAIEHGSAGHSCDETTWRKILAL